MSEEGGGGAPPHRRPEQQLSATNTAAHTAGPRGSKARLASGPLRASTRPDPGCSDPTRPRMLRPDPAEDAPTRDGRRILGRVGAAQVGSEQPRSSRSSPGRVGLLRPGPLRLGSGCSDPGCRAAPTRPGLLRLGSGWSGAARREEVGGGFSALLLQESSAFVLNPLRSAPRMRASAVFIYVNTIIPPL
ncbi:hypothetical protein CRUP_032245 [Coryphaenoides rupestris]|nr:hypothetical protein CRUP_032245 [Coryphaenoides rupestris]